MIKDFFIDSFKIKGDYFFNKKTKLKFLNKLQNRFFHLFNKKQIVWANITFINSSKVNSVKRHLIIYNYTNNKKELFNCFKICNKKRES